MRTCSFVAVALLCGAAACGGAGTEPAAVGTGRYTLQTVNGLSLPVASTFLCGDSFTGGHLEIGTDSVVRTYFTTHGAGGATTSTEWRGSYTKVADGMLVVSYSAFSVIRDTISVSRGGRLRHRAWLAVSEDCAGTILTTVDFGFTPD